MKLLLALLLAATAAAADPGATRAASEFPTGDEAFHTYREMVADIRATAAAHPAIVQLGTIGTSYLGRQLWVAKVSDNVTQDEDEPELLFDGLVHAREHMGAEMALVWFHTLVDGYGGTDAMGQRVTRIVDSREIWIVFMVNPDGGEYDISGGTYHYWRKDRQPIPGSSQIGTDINRNFAYRWGCCGGASADPGSIVYRGPAPWSAPETAALRDFVDSRVVGGRQQLAIAVSFHTQGRLVLWPYGWTAADVPRDMTVDDSVALAALGHALADRNGYRPTQGGDLYTASGTFGDWMYHEHRIFTFTLEMTTERYPPASEIGPETSRNLDGLLFIAELADCPHRFVGTEARHCGPFADDLEIGRGWTVDPLGTDTAAGGAWQRGRPERTADALAAYQPGNAASGTGALITGLAAGATPDSGDVDGGRTSVRSRSFALPAVGAGQTLELGFRWTFAHDARSSGSDRFRIAIVDAAGAATPVFTVRGTATTRAAAWRAASVDITGFAGSTVSLEVDAVDGGGPSLVEAGLDDVFVHVVEGSAWRPAGRQG